MRLICISDTHGNEFPSLPDGDVLIHSGDAGIVSEQSIAKLNRMFGDLKDKFKHIIYVPGNHDLFFEKQFRLAQTMLSNAIVLNDSGIVIQDKLFWGSPITPWYFDWAFNRNRGDDILRHWNLIPSNTDVLVTHGPCYGILDLTLDGRNVGCNDLLNAVKRIRPIAHICGHIHEAYGCMHKEFKKGKERYFVKFANAALCDTRNNLVSRPIIVEV